MNILIILICLFWSARILSNLLSYINLWYIKEYRLDRMLIHLKTKQGKLLFFLPFRKPPVSPKTTVLLAMGILCCIAIFHILRLNIFIKFLFIDLISFPVISLWVIILKIPTFFYHKYIIYRAMEKFRRHRKILVIGITGSVGKTSLKEFLYTILSEKFRVLKTAASKNSLIGISETVLSNLKPEHEVFIAEMGAYKTGEISGMARSIRPQIGLVTSINAQHQDLFGSIDNTVNAKYELIKGLTGRKIAVFNADNPYTLKMAKWAHDEGKQVWLFSAGDTVIPDWTDKSIKATDIRADLSGIKFNIVFLDKTINCEAQVLGRHQVGNILAACCIGLILKMDMNAIIRAVKKLRNYPKTMEPFKGVNGSVFINDTFNNSPDAARAAIDYLALNPGKKILVFQPMIELGKYAAKAHEEIGRYAAKYCDNIFLTNKNYYKFFVTGAKSVKPEAELPVLSFSDIAQNIKQNVKTGDLVLFKGKEAENIFKILTK